MTQEEIIDMAETAGMTRDGDMWFSNGKSDMDVHISHLEAFAKLVDAKATAREREKSLKLWMLLDDIDTADDIAKTDDDVYRSLCRQLHEKRWDVLNGDEVDDAIRNRGDL